MDQPELIPSQPRSTERKTPTAPPGTTNSEQRTTNPRSSERQTSAAPEGLVSRSGGTGSGGGRELARPTTEPKRVEIVLHIVPSEARQSQPPEPGPGDAARTVLSPQPKDDSGVDPLRAPSRPLRSNPIPQPEDDAGLGPVTTPETSERGASAEAEPEQIPARMLNEFVYCQRLFYYEFVEGVFVENADTVHGKALHARVDSGTGAMPAAQKAPAKSSAERATQPATAEQPAESEKPEKPEKVEQPEEVIHSRSVQMGSARLGVTAKMDLVESHADQDDLFSAFAVCPVDYKAGAPKEGTAANELWDADKMQLGLQCLILRDNGYTCREGIIYYRATKQRVRLPVTRELELWVADQIARARAVARGAIPSPLVNSPKCPRCSLVTICLPDETCLLAREGAGGEGQRAEGQRAEGEGQRGEGGPPRRLMAARDDCRSLYLNTHGLRVGRKDEVLQIKQEAATIDEVRISDISHVALFGNIQISTQALQALCEAEKPITYFSMGGWFYGITRGHELKNVFLRIAQFRLARDPGACLRLARQFVHGKIRNHRTLLMRNHVEAPDAALLRLKQAAETVLGASNVEELLGFEGAAAGCYFEQFSGMIKVPGEQQELDGLGPVSTAAEAPEKQRSEVGGQRSGRGPVRTAAEAPEEQKSEVGGQRSAAEPVCTLPENPQSAPGSRPTDRFAFNFQFTHRNRRPPTDPVNALLSLSYSLLAKDCTVAVLAVGFDPYVGFFHQPRFGRPALALDLMEEVRPLIAESTVLSCINNRVVTEKDFVRAGEAVNLTAAGRKRFFQVYEQRMNSLLTHPVFDYKVSYRRALELQARLLAKAVTGEIPDYVPLVTR